MKLFILFRHKFSALFVIISFILNVLLWIFLIYKIHPQDEPIFLHYNIYFGVDLIGQWYRIFFIPLSGSIIWVFNTLFAAYIYERDKVMHYFLISTSFAVQIILIVAAVLILLIN